VSYFEWVQNNENEQWDEDEVNGKMKGKMLRSTDAVIDAQKRINDSLVDIQAARNKRGLDGEPLQPVDLRMAAYVLAVSRVAEITLERGIWP